MNNTYKLVIRPPLHFVVSGHGPLLTEEMVLEALTGVGIYELSEDELGNRTLHVELPRESDAEAWMHLFCSPNGSASLFSKRRSASGQPNP